MEKLSGNWLFAQHSQQTIREWLRRLRYFYFIRAWGGHANDGDEFRAALLFADRQDLITKIGQLGLTLNAISDTFPISVTGQPRSTEESNKLSHCIKRFPDLKQLGHSVIFGYKAFIWLHDNSIHITISGTRDGNYYEVTDDDVEVCVALEKHFDNLGWQTIIDTSLENSACCISRTKYPELYGA